MKADYLSYKRATNASLLGLALQLFMGLILLIYGVVQSDQAAQSGSIFVLAGIPVWLTLAIVFDQHRRERIEDLENQALIESGAREASAFTEGGDDFRVAHKRLVWMHQYLVPAASLLTAALLVGVGIWRYQVGREYLDLDKFVSTPSFGWPIALGLILSFTGFVFARYIAGMAKQPVWANLRAGAAAAVGAAVVGILLAAAQFIDYAGPNLAIRYLHVVYPVMMFVLAGEYTLNFLMGIYSPRKPGEFPRPAFDSRLLGFIAAPDKVAESISEAISYQFGYDVSSSWFYQLLRRRILALSIVGVGIIWALTCFSIIQPNQQGIRVRFGQLIDKDKPLQPGIYAKLPWPFEQVDTFAATAAREINLGGEPPKLKDKAILWTNDHGVTETYFVVQPDPADKEMEYDQEAAVKSGKVPDPIALSHDDTAARTDQLTAVKDNALVAAEVPLVYAITDYVKYDKFATPDNRDDIIRSVAQRELFRYLATQSLDQVLGEGRTAISYALKDRIQTALAKLDAGVQVLFVAIEGVHPPREAAASFEAVVQSGQKREGALRNAEDQANKSLIEVAGNISTARHIVEAIQKFESYKQSAGPNPTPEQDKASAELQQDVEDLLAKAGGSAAATIQKARAERWVRHMDARSRAEEHVGRLASFRACPQAYAAQIYFKTLEDMMSKARVFIVADTCPVRIVGDLKEPESTGNIFLKPKDKNGDIGE